MGSQNQSTGRWSFRYDWIWSSVDAMRPQSLHWLTLPPAYWLHSLVQVVTNRHCSPGLSPLGLKSSSREMALVSSHTYPLKLG